MISASEGSSRLVVYGHGYCGHSRYMRTILDERKIDYEWRDVMEGAAEFKQQLKAMAKGCLSVPTVVFPDGSFLVEPTPLAVLKKLKAAQGGPGESQRTVIATTEGDSSLA